MMKRVFAGLFLSLSMVAVGCVAGPVDQQEPAEGSSEDVGQAAEAMHSCPEQTWCTDACDSVDRVWYGKCNDTDGGCLCRVPLDRPDTGGGMICYINWNVGWGEWTCLSV